MGSSPSRSRYEVVIAGARCAGASTAMLLARRGLSVLAVDPLRFGADTLSTHALMRGAVLQLHRWDLLGEIRATDAPAIHRTTFHYGEREVPVPIEPRHGVEALFAPRRTVLDPILVEAARDAGAEVLHRRSVVGLLRDADGRVRGARIAGAGHEDVEVSADLVIGADGIRSRVARILEIPVDYEAPHAACSIYGYWPHVPLEGYHWFYEPGLSIGTIPTNGGDTCLFALLPQSVFEARRLEGLDVLFHEAIQRVSPALAEHVRDTPRSGKLRAFAGRRSFLRRAAGPGWALVGDAGYYRDPITAHGITDALREAELLARAVAGDAAGGLEEYQAGRDARVKGLLDTTDRIASFDWDLDGVWDLHRKLARQMKDQMDVQLDLD